MKKLPVYLATFLILFVVVALVYFTIPYLFDGRIETVLQKYETTKNPEIVRTYLISRSEAQDHEARIGFIQWGRKHQDGFIEIVDGLDQSQRTNQCENLAFAATDSGQDLAFETAFQNYESECLRIIRLEMAKYRSFHSR